jgi:hypothetical protein
VHIGSVDGAGYVGHKVLRESVSALDMVHLLHAGFGRELHHQLTAVAG